jgi:hypothetical protein
MEEKQKKKLDLSQQNKRSGTNGVRYWWPLSRVSLTDPKFAQFNR